MVTAYEAAATCVNDTAPAVVFTNEVAVVVRMELLGNHHTGPFVNRISRLEVFPLCHKENIGLARVAK
jgi:hypothetical protein